MTSNRSSCSAGALLKSELRQQAPLLMVSIVSALLTMPVLMIPFLQNTISEQRNFPTRQDFLKYLQEMLEQRLWSNEPGKALLMLLAVAAAISIFRYLHSRQQIDFYHSLPISRGKLYAVKYVVGVIAVLPAYLIGFALSCMIVCLYGYGSMLPELFAYPLLIIVVGFLLIYTVSVLCMIVCGNTLVSLLVMFWVHLGLGVAEIVATSVIDLFYPTAVLDAGVYTMMERLVPLAYILRISDFRYLFFGVQYGDGSVGISANNDPMDVTWFIAAAVACVLLIVLGYVLSCMRKSESASMAIAFRGLKPPLSVFIHAVMTIGGGVLLSTTYQFSLWLFVLGAAIGALLAHCAVEIIYDLDFAGIKNGWKAFGVYAVVAAAVIAGMNVDITGFNSRIPNRADVAGVNLKSDDRLLSAEAYEIQTQNYWYADEDMFDDPREYAPLASDENINTVLQLASVGVDNGAKRETWYNAEHTSYTVEFSLKNGRTFRRQYYFTGDDENKALEQAKTLAERMRTSKEYRRERLAINQIDPNQVSMLATQSLITMTSDNGEFGITEPPIGGWDFVHRTQDTKQIRTILNTIKKEYTQLTPQYARLHQPVLILRTIDSEIYRKMKTDGGSGEESFLSLLSDNYCMYRNMQNIPVYSNFTETLSLLERYFGKVNYTYPPEKVSKLRVLWYDADDTEAVPADTKISSEKDYAVEENSVEVTNRNDIAVLLKYAAHADMNAFSEVAPEMYRESSMEFTFGQEEIYTDLLDVEAVHNVLEKYRS